MRNPVRSAARKAEFLALFAQIGSVEGACEQMHPAMDSRIHRSWLAKSARYAEAFHIATEQAIQKLEVEARRRAMGWDEPVYQQGAKVGEIRKHSDLLMMFLLKSYR